MYIGELVRLALCDLIEQKLIFVDQNTSKVFKHQAIPTKYVSIIEKYIEYSVFINISILQEANFVNFAFI